MKPINPNPEPIDIPPIHPPLIPYGSWHELIGTESPEAHVQRAVDEYKAGRLPEPDVDFGRACRDFRQTIAWTLPVGVELIGNLFYGEPDATFPGYAQNPDGSLNIQGIIELIAVDVIVDRRRIRDDA